MHNIQSIEGIGRYYAKQLHDCGIDYQEQFLECCASRRSRKKLAEKSGISHKLILKWANQADLSRIKGVGEEYSELLEKSGVDTVVELAHRNPFNLFKKLKATNNKHHLVRRMPNEKQMINWILQAQLLPRAISY